MGGRQWGMSGGWRWWAVGGLMGAGCKVVGVGWWV